MKEHLFPTGAEPVVLNSYMRGLLLAEICKRLNLPGFFRYTLGIPLEFGKTTGRGPCPWCRKAGAFTAGRKTGQCRCSRCGRTADLLTLVNEKENQELHSTLIFLTGYLEPAEKRERQACHG